MYCFHNIIIELITIQNILNYNNKEIEDDLHVFFNNDLDKLITIINKINRRFDTESIIYGHAGNGNLHICLISKRKDKKLLKKIAKNFFIKVIKMGGTITAEHGDGLPRSEFVKLQYGNKNYKIFRELKKLFDQDNVLNPGKIITEESQIVRNLIQF